VVNRDRYSLVYFHLTTAFFNTDSIKFGMRIFDERNHLVFEDVNPVAWAPNYNRLSKSWVIRGADGSFVPTGVYRAEFWIDESAVYDYYFKVVSQDSDALKNAWKKDEKETRKPQQKKMDENAGSVLRRQLERKLSYPKGVVWFAVAYVGYMLLMAGSSGDMGLTVVAGLAALAFGGVKLIQYTKRYVCKSWIGAVLLTVLGNGIYGLFLMVASVGTLLKGRIWKQQLNKLID
jgi:hypothetical protein